MAAFLLRGIGQDESLPSYQGYFSDIPAGQWFTPYVERLYELGISTGYGDGRFGPGSPVTRAEMAAFILRALDEDARVGPYRGVFADVSSTAWYAQLSERLYDLGITNGCHASPLRYCPNGAVRRDEMASFLARALELEAIDVVDDDLYLFGPHIGGAGGWEVLDGKFTGAHFSPYPEKVIEILNAAQAEGKSVILLLARSSSHYKNPDDTFNLDMWKAAIDQFAAIDFSPWIEDGTFRAHYLVSEPMAHNRWGGEVITVPVLDEMARYSKQYWPALTTAVREHPTDLIAHAGGRRTPIPGWEWTYLDTAWARYSADKGPIAVFIDEEVTAARAQNLGLILGMNVLNGGDGSSGVFGLSGWTMSVAELLDYGTKLISEPYGCAMLMWHYSHGDTGYFERPEIDEAMSSLSAVALSRQSTTCLPH